VGQRHEPLLRDHHYGAAARRGGDGRRAAARGGVRAWRRSAMDRADPATAGVHCGGALAADRRASIQGRGVSFANWRGRHYADASARRDGRSGSNYGAGSSDASASGATDGAHAASHGACDSARRDGGANGSGHAGGRRDETARALGSGHRALAPGPGGRGENARDGAWIHRKAGRRAARAEWEIPGSYRAFSRWGKRRSCRCSPAGARVHGRVRGESRGVAERRPRLEKVVSEKKPGLAILVAAVCLVGIGLLLAGLVARGRG
jgi:hypothetical protein